MPAGAVIDPADLVSVALDGLEAGEVEIFDSLGRKAKEYLSGPPTSFPFAV